MTEERRHNLSHLSEEELQHLIDDAVDLAFTKSIDRLIMEISKQFFKKILWAVVLGLISFVAGNHLVK